MQRIPLLLAAALIVSAPIAAAVTSDSFAAAKAKKAAKVTKVEKRKEVPKVVGVEGGSSAKGACPDAFCNIGPGTYPRFDLSEPPGIKQSGGGKKGTVRSEPTGGGVPAAAE